MGVFVEATDAPGAAGDFKADVQLTGSANTKVKKTLGKAKIAGGIIDSFWEILVGDVGSITAGIIDSSTIRAGIDPSVAANERPDEPDDFAAHSSMGNVTLEGIKGQARGTPTFLNSVLAAWQMGAIKLEIVKTDNSAHGNATFGLAADFIKSVTGQKLDGANFPMPGRLDVPGDVPPAFDFGDFKLVLVEA